MLFLLAVPEISMQIKGLFSNDGLAINTGFLAKKKTGFDEIKFVSHLFIFYFVSL